MNAMRVLGYYARMIAVTLLFMVVGAAFFPVYVVGETWRTWRQKRGRR